jgi:hypothetical protein
MNILFANHHLDMRAGSELYTLELATALRERGHVVTAFTFEAGLVAEELRRKGVPVFGPADHQVIDELPCDVAHVHHTPCLYYLGATRLRCPALFSMLGIFPPLEAPPIVWDGVSNSLAVSKEVRDSAARTPFGRALPPIVFQNWFDDRVELPRAKPPSAVRRVAVVTNHLPPLLKANLDRIAERQSGFTWEHFGFPERSVPITVELLDPFDVVLTIGRSALLASALGKPCLLIDIHGCDGFVEASRLDALAAFNFSGRMVGAQPSLEELEHLLFVAALKVDLDATTTLMRKQFSLRRRVEEIEGIHSAAVASGVRLGDHPNAYGRAGDVHAEQLRRLGSLQAFLQCREAVFTTKQREFDALEAALATSEAEAKVLRQANVSLERELSDARKALSSADARLSKIEQSAGMRLLTASKRIPGFHQGYLLAKKLGDKIYSSG